MQAYSVAVMTHVIALEANLARGDLSLLHRYCCCYLQTLLLSTADPGLQTLMAAYGIKAINYTLL